MGDTFFFFSLNSLGAGRIAIVECLYSPFVIGLAALWLGERLSACRLIGASSSPLGRLRRGAEGRRAPDERRSILRGVLFGALGLAAMAVGIVTGETAARAIADPVGDGDPPVRRHRGAGDHARRCIRRAGPSWASIHSPQRWGYTLSGSLVGSYLSMFLWLSGMKLAPASVAAVLNQTSNIFILVFAALFLRERITRTRLVGIALGFAGALLVMLG